MIALLAPIGLAALAALALPIVIHLLRRAQEHEVTFAALRWLRDREHPSTRLRIHERVALALRVLLIATLAALLALPVWRGAAQPATPWVALAPGVAASDVRAAVGAPEAQWHWLTPGFPPVDAGPAPAGAPPLSLVRELDAALPPGTALTVVVPRELGDLDGERARVAGDVIWRVVPGRSPGGERAASAAPPRVAVRYAQGGEPELAVAAALARTWEAAGRAQPLDAGAAGAPLPPGTDWLFWLAGDPPAAIEEWVANGGVALYSDRPSASGRVLLRDENGGVLLREKRIGRGRLLASAVALRPDAMPALLAADFPERLRWLMDGGDATPDRAPGAAMAPRAVASDARGAAVSLDGALALLAALVFLAERAWATRPRASPA